MSDNKKILDQVKNAVSSKKLNEKKPKNDYRDKDNSNETKKIVDSWIKNNAEKITKEVINEHVKKLFKQKLFKKNLVLKLSNNKLKGYMILV